MRRQRGHVGRINQIHLVESEHKLVAVVGQRRQELIVDEAIAVFLGIEQPDDAINGGDKAFNGVAMSAA